MSTFDLLVIICLVLACWISAILGWALLQAQRRARQAEAARRVLVGQMSQAELDYQRSAHELAVRTAESQQRAVEELSAARAADQRIATVLAAANARAAGLEKTLEAARSEAWNLSQALERFTPIRDLERACDEARTNLVNLRRETDDFKYRSEKEQGASLARLKEEFAAAQRDTVTRRDEAKSEIARLTSTIEQLSTQLAELEEKELLQSFGFYQQRYGLISSEAYKLRLGENRERQKLMIKDRTAATCKTAWTIDGSTKKGEKHTNDFLRLMLRGFNGECDACVAQVKYNNVQVMESRIQKCFEAIKKLATSHTSEITLPFLKLKLAELHLAHEFQEKRQAEADEQRRLREQMKDEEKAQAELERARREAETEERRYTAALAKARTEVESAAGARQAKLQQEIELLQTQLAQASERKERAISRAQQTRSGHVYVISNIGSFGEDIYKIGMTRREDPLDRVRELGDASVPFPFDIHAIIQTEDAPALENTLHRMFHTRRVNLINERKEFFRVSLSEIETIVRESHSHIEFTQIAQAEEYRKTISRAAEHLASSNVLDEARRGKESYASGARG